MPRFFNTAGPCRAEDHYMLPAERRIGDLRKLIDEKLYFIVHAPRQVGKTTSLQALAESLTAEGRYTALLTSCEVGQKMVPNLEGSMAGILSVLQTQAEIYLPEPLRPPPIDLRESPESRLHDLLHRWATLSDAAGSTCASAGQPQQVSNARRSSSRSGATARATRPRAGSTSSASISIGWGSGRGRWWSSISERKRFRSPNAAS